MPQKMIKKSGTHGGTATKVRASAVAKRRALETRATPAAAPVAIPRATSAFDEDDVLLSGGGTKGAGFGRCGGRVLSSRIEQILCDKLSVMGVTHSHSPRHFEVRLAEKAVAAYAPMVVLRGRGREGKTIVIEAASEIDRGTLGKIAAFREKMGLEFYVVFIAPEEILDAVPVATYDESCTTTDLDTLVSRLAD